MPIMTNFCGIIPAIAVPFRADYGVDEPELRRALAAVTRGLIGELQQWDPSLCARLSPLLHEFGAPQAQARTPSSPHVLAEQEG